MPANPMVMAEPERETAALSRGDVRVAAPAKVNLYLHVTGRRADGFHRLDSLVVFAGIGDVLAASPADDLSLEIDGPFGAGLPADSGNLVLRAASALAARAGIVPRARIGLIKNLPVASGIGGGSADAAAALRGLSRLWGLESGTAEMADLALSLGADVPVCLAGVPSFIGGIGERIVPAPRLPDAWLVLVNPGVAVSTQAVFKARRGHFTVPARFDAVPGDAAGLAALLMERGNDLMSAAASQAPVIGEVLTMLADDRDCLLARMSGSGATCFALFAGEGSARRSAARVQAAHPGWWVAPAPMLTKASGLDAG